MGTQAGALRTPPDHAQVLEDRSQEISADQRRMPRESAGVEDRPVGLVQPKDLLPRRGGVVGEERLDLLGRLGQAGEGGVDARVQLRPQRGQQGVADEVPAVGRLDVGGIGSPLEAAGTAVVLDLAATASQQGCEEEEPPRVWEEFTLSAQARARRI